MTDFLKFCGVVLAALLFAGSQFGDLLAARDGRFVQASLDAAVTGPAQGSDLR